MPIYKQTAEEEDPMRERTAVRRRGSPAFAQGLIFGIVLGAIQVGLSYLIEKAHLTQYTLVITSIGAMIAVVMYLFAGIRAAEKTGRVGSGAFAGFWTGLISALIALIGALLLASTNLTLLLQQAEILLQASNRQLNPSTPISANQLLLGAAGITGLMLSLLAGLLIGAIGGLVGKSHTTRESRYQEEPALNTPPSPK